MERSYRRFAQSCEGVEDELRLGQDGDRVGRGLGADGAARFGLPVEDQRVFGRCILADFGQAIIKFVEDDAYCVEVIKQIAAVRGALDRVSRIERSR